MYRIVLHVVLEVGSKMSVAVPTLESNGIWRMAVRLWEKILFPL